uniref:Coiled-coil-helix-coiled-coil-helix domain-containing protein 7 n=1 Tax=Trichuris muris TaxID=70415 RepID=A0A5S6Q0V8_TRIMR
MHTPQVSDTTKRRQDEKRFENGACNTEAGISMQCIINAHGNQALCRKEAQNYNLCRAFWERVKKERLAKGESPALPSAEERDGILQKHFYS